MSIYEEKTRGGLLGHVIRRLLHVAIFVLPLFYYAYIHSIVGFLHLTLNEFLWGLIVLVIVLEALRLWRGWLAFGQRSNEAKRISAFTWTVVSILLVLLYAPSKMFAIPIIWSCAFADPFMGELRRVDVSRIWVALTGVLMVAAIWLICTWWLGTPWWWAVVMGPFIIACEWPNLRWVDDNAMMLLLPLVLVQF